MHRAKHILNSISVQKCFIKFMYLQSLSSNHGFNYFRKTHFFHICILIFRGQPFYNSSLDPKEVSYQIWCFYLPCNDNEITFCPTWVRMSDPSLFAEIARFQSLSKGVYDMCVYIYIYQGWIKY